LIDSSSGYVRFDNAEKLAMELEGAYFRLDDLNSDKLADSIRAIIR
jgi:Mg-chelatase subunit ChlD